MIGKDSHRHDNSFLLFEFVMFKGGGGGGVSELCLRDNVW